jgi:LuxR family maltose regulon positive regulatory protein
MREKEVLRLIADGCSTKEVARCLVISEGTVKTHMKRIYAKLEVRSRTQAIVRAQTLGLL